jgi:mannose-6-phosphate isomerase-like protein (cupin superfamily)
MVARMPPITPGRRPFETAALPDDFVLAPDGSEIRPLLELGGGSMAHCTLAPGTTALAVRHRTVEELWYVLEGEGEIVRVQGAREEVVALGPGTCVSIPLGTAFQFRATGPGPLRLVLVTMPPWPGADEAERARDVWPPSVPAGP